MTHLLDILAEVPFGQAVVAATAAAVLWQVFVAVGIVAGTRRIHRSASRIEAIARRGEPERARIQARRGQRALKPLLQTLQGSNQLPKTQGLGGTIVGCAAVLVPSVTVLAAAFTPLDARTQLLLVSSSSILMPTGLLMARTILLTRESAFRRVRRACVPFLEENVRQAEENDRLDAAQTRVEEAFGG